MTLEAFLPMRAALIALTDQLHLTSSQQSDLVRHDLPRITTATAKALFIVVAGGTHLIVVHNALTRKILAYHLRHGGQCFQFDGQAFVACPPDTALTALNHFPKHEPGTIH